MFGHDFSDASNGQQRERERHSKNYLKNKNDE